MSTNAALEKLQNTLRQNEAKLARYGVSRIGIFGSFAHGRQTPTSDIDILVELRSEFKTFKNFMALVAFLEDIFGRKVELVTPESLSPYLKEQILKDTAYVQVA